MGVWAEEFGWGGGRGNSLEEDLVQSDQSFEWVQEEGIDRNVMVCFRESVCAWLCMCLYKFKSGLLSLFSRCLLSAFSVFTSPPFYVKGGRSVFSATSS
jgi:hypothetical protein